MFNNRLSLGKKGEAQARKHLKKQGYRILEQNYRCRFGEIDLIAEHDGCLVFVEVKTRSGLAFGQPSEAVTRHKQQQISKVALEYMAKSGLRDRAARFDVVAVLTHDNSSPTIEIIPAAFELCYSE